MVKLIEIVGQKSILTPLLLSVVLLVLPFSVEAQTQTTSFGGEDGWSDTSMYNLAESNGSITPAFREAEVLPNTSLLLHFNEITSRDATGHFDLMTVPSINNNLKILGAGSAFFEGDNPINLIPATADGEYDDSGAFNSGELLHRSPQRLTISFYIYPFYLRDGETIFRFNNRIRIFDRLIYQDITCIVNKQHLVWRFRNTFLTGDSMQSEEITEISSSQIIPGEWRHMHLDYDSINGKMEILLDGLSDAVVYVTDNGRESGLAKPFILGPFYDDSMTIGGHFFGVLDEFLVVQNPLPASDNSAHDLLLNKTLNPYEREGYLLTAIRDLGQRNSRISGLSAHVDTPGDSVIEFRYMLSDSLSEVIQERQRLVDAQHMTAEDPFDISLKRLNGSLFAPGDSYVRMIVGDADEQRGRYLLVQVSMMGDIAHQEPPVLRYFQVNYEWTPLPPPPLQVWAEQRGDDVVLSWNIAPDSTVNNIEGYMVYIGEFPGQYLHGLSPIDAGNSDNLVISGLIPRQQYYFAVASYDDAQPPRIGPYSQSVYLRVAD